MKFGIALLRVSTDKQFQHGESVDTQTQRVQMMADRDEVDIVRFFVEHFSGRKTDRAAINEMLAFLDEHKGEIDFVYIVQIDRFTRAGSEVYLYLKRQLMKRGVQLRDTMGTIQKSVNTLEHVGFEYEWSVVSPSRTAEIMQAEHANAEATHILTRTIGQQIKLAGQGYQVRPAVIGFKNGKTVTEDGRELPIMIPDEVEGTWFVRMFELSADGSMTDEDICERINNMGFKTRRLLKRDKRTQKVIGTKGEKKLTPKMLAKYRTKPIYCGVRVEKWTHYAPIRAPFAGLVSIDLFNKANRGRVFITEDKTGNLSIEYNKKNYRRSASNEDFKLRHVVGCSHCHKPMLGSYSKNRKGNAFGYYHCSRKHKYFAVPKDEFESAIGYYLENLKMKPSFMGLFKECVREIWLEKHNASVAELGVVSEHIEDLISRQNVLIEKLQHLSSVIVIRKLEAEIESLEMTIKDTKKRKIEYEIKADHIEEYFTYAKDAIEHLENCTWSTLGKAELGKLWGFIFNERPSFQQLKSGTARLSLLYRLNRDFKGDKMQMASHLRKFWNRFEIDIKRFNMG